MSSKVSALAAACLLLLLGWAWQAWHLSSIYRGDFIDDSQLKIRAATTREGGMGLEQIAGLHLFGNPAEKVVDVAPVATELPKTDLKLVLAGAITDSDPGKASALIDAERVTRRYYVGDSIPGGAVLHEVRPDSVVLKRDNRFEILAFPKGGENNALARPAMPNTAVTPAPTPAPRSVPVPANKPGGMPASELRGLTLRERLQNARRNGQ